MLTHLLFSSFSSGWRRHRAAQNICECVASAKRAPAQIYIIFALLLLLLLYSLLFILRVKALTPDRSNKWRMTSSSCSRRSTSWQVGVLHNWKPYIMHYSDFLSKLLASDVLTGCWVVCVCVLALTGIKESDTGLAPPALWDLAADKQTLQSEQPLQVAR